MFLRAWINSLILTLNAPIATKVVCFSCLLKCLRSLYAKQCGPRSDCSYMSTLFASIPNSSVMLGNYLQQTISADDIFRCIFFLALYDGILKRTTFIKKVMLKKYLHLKMLPALYICCINSSAFQPFSLKQTI